MTARVLVVDDILANVKLLEARLTAEYFEVMTAMNGMEALEMVEAGQCDIVLLDVMMPGMDGFEVCSRIKGNPACHHIPVVMVTALDQPADRIRGLEAGADDFLTKPVSDIALVTRVKSLVRLKMLTDELRTRAATSRDMGMTDPFEEAASQAAENGRVLVVDDRPSSHARIRDTLKRVHSIDIEQNPQEALFRVAEGHYEVLIISLDLQGFDGLRLCSQVRSLDRTRDLPILIVVDPDDNARLMRGLDMGVNDYVMRPIDKNELLARVNTQVRRRRYAERLRDNVQLSMAMAVTDPLTGLHNRRYMESHLETLLQQAKERGRSLSVLILDIDYFKSINDTHGHDVGDEVLREFAARLRKNVRGIDLACRFGGEEFVVVMPETELSVAMKVAERLRESIAGSSFPIEHGAGLINVTVSVGVARFERADESLDTLLKRADIALYNAKQDGRNRVVADAA
ncbi:MAG: PleD family two-component system response regulator [Pseudomonadota bacterium]